MRPCVFLDRDGTLIEEVGYLDRLERLQLFPWSVDAVRLLNQAGFAVAVVSNQAGVARGFFPETFVHQVADEIDRRVEAAGGRIAGWYHCPHHPDAPIAEYRQRCECRKPRPGMIRKAERELGIDLARSFVIGDRWLDVQLAHGVGAQGILVRTGYGGTEEGAPPDGVKADAVVDNLIAAVTWILTAAHAGLRP